jgi:hypothetical protein
MKSRVRKRNSPAAWLVTILIGSSACQSDDSSVSVETVVLAKGEYYGLQWGGTQVERFHVVARRTSDAAVASASDEAVIVTPGQGDPCSLGDQIGSFRTIEPRNNGKYVIGSPSPARVPVWDALDDQGRGNFHFVDLTCQSIDPQVPEVSKGDYWQIYQTDLEKLQLAVVDQDQNLLLLDPWGDATDAAATQTQIASGVTWVDPIDPSIWTIENGELVQRDSTGNEQLRKGTNVSSVEFISGEHDVAWIDDHGVFVYRGGVQRKLPKDACTITQIDGFRAGAIAYFSPCGDRRLVIEASGGDPISYQSAVDDYQGQAGRLIFTTHDDTTTKIWVVLATEPDQASQLASLPQFSLQNLLFTRSGQLQAEVQLPDNTLQLWQIDQAGQISILFDNVSDLATGGGGTLALLQTDGTLSLLDRDATRLLWRANGVPSRGFRFVFNGNSTALAYRSQYDSTTMLGRLELQFISGEHFVVDQNVSEFHEVWWPEPGLLYARMGDDPAMMFGRVDIPCQVSSDTPWACGF